MDAQVARRESARLAELLAKFVCVRAVEMEGVDLSLFQFDYDQTWLAFFMNADKTIYGRYGTRASGGADVGVDVSIQGFEAALEGALEVHAGYPANKASLAGKRAEPPAENEIRSFPLFKSRFAEAPPRGCAHCHHVWEALRDTPRSQRKPLPDDLMWPYPKPDRAGLVLALNERATVKSVTPDSPAAKAGFAKGDRIVTLSGQPVLSMGDVQWVLHHAVPPCDIAAEVKRGPSAPPPDRASALMGETKALTLHLDPGWRLGEDITWRASTRFIRAFGWQEATPAQRTQLGIKDGNLCVRVKGMPKTGPAQRAGLAVGDFIVEIDGRAAAIDENAFLAYLQQDKLRGEIVTLTVIHDGRRDKRRLPAP